MQDEASAPAVVVCAASGQQDYGSQPSEIAVIHVGQVDVDLLQPVRESSQRIQQSGVGVPVDVAGYRQASRAADAGGDPQHSVVIGRVRGGHRGSSRWVGQGSSTSLHQFFTSPGKLSYSTLS